LIADFLCVQRRGVVITDQKLNDFDSVIDLEPGVTSKAGQTVAQSLPVIWCRAFDELNQ
jgi:hypothetical protein